MYPPSVGWSNRKVGGVVSGAAAAVPAVANAQSASAAQVILTTRMGRTLRPRASPRAGPARGQDSAAAGGTRQPMPEAARTLVKSPPELWAEVSDPDSLARHLGGVGEIRITRLEPESTVAWEGTRIRGTVDLAPAGWGTKVTVSAEEVAAVEPPAEPEVKPQAADAPAPVVESETEPLVAKQSRWARWFRRRPEPTPEAVAEPDPAPEPEPAAAVEPAPEPTDTAAVLEDMLGSLGSAHHRPFSR